MSVKNPSDMSDHHSLCKDDGNKWIFSSNREVVNGMCSFN